MRWMALGLLLVIPWIATYAGSWLGCYVKLKNDGTQRGFLGFAGGVMVAAAIWSLIIPAFDGLAVLPGILVTTAGFALGCLSMLALDKLLPHQHLEADAPEGHASHLSRPMLLVMAVALHNIPEGLALGVVLTAALEGGISGASALAFALGLALQNFPEGMAVVVPLIQSGVSRKKALRFGGLASFAEPVAALVGLGFSLWLASLGGITLSLLLSLAAGSMMFIVVEELIPASQAGEGTHAPTYGFLLGFWIMAIMGVVAG